jgi:hypothetical protein
MKKSLFNCAAILHEKKDNEIESTILIEPKAILSTSPEAAGFTIVREIPEEHGDKFDNIEIIVRPF